jgi:glutamine synthetase type III
VLAEKLKRAADSAYAERAKTRKYVDSALAYKNNVIPLMVKLREAVDEMECIVPSKLWPLPSYGEMTMKQ